MIDNTSNITFILGLTMGMGLLVLLVVTTTSFIKVAVVLFIVRNALGIQQAPPNIVLYTIALALTAFVAAPVFSEINHQVFIQQTTPSNFDEWVAAFERAREPVKEFLIRFTNAEQREFFVLASKQVWPEDTVIAYGSTDLSVLIPSFLVMELQRAFEIGLLLYLPMIVVDLVVTTVLMAMGMSMVTPTIIATPMKLFLFVSIDGWTRLIEGLIMTYSVGG